MCFEALHRHVCAIAEVQHEEASVVGWDHNVALHDATCLVRLLGIARQARKVCPVIHTVHLKTNDLIISIACPEVLRRLTAIVFYIMRNRDYRTSA